MAAIYSCTALFKKAIAATFNGESLTKAYDGNRNVADLTDQSGNTTSFGYDAYGRMASIQLATGYARQYLYNEKDLISQYINANEETTAYTYDNLNRLSTMTDTLGTTEISYDKNSNVTQLEDANSQIVKTYDALDRLTQATDADGNTISYTYDEVGNLTTITYPDDSVVAYAYDNLNRLVSVTDFNNKVTAYTYDSDSRLIRMDRGDESYETYTYDLKNQLQTVIDRTEQGVLISDTAYTYDAAGDIVREEEFVSDIRKENNYSDNHSLIGQSVYKNDELIKQYAYSYDETGNILNVQNGRFENTTDDVLEWTTDGDSFTYTTGNVIDTFNGEAIEYDPEGNLTDAVIRGNAETFTYDQRNNLLQAFGIQYQYDLEDDRIGRTEGESETHYVVDKNNALSRVLVRNTDGTLTKYVYGIGLLAEYKEGAGLYYHYDYRGSTIALTDDTGAVVDRYSYDPYGAVTEHEGSSNVDYLYCGKHSVSSEGNGLYFMHSRYYFTDLKRFLTEDKYAGKYSDITSLNQFAYVNGNPVNFVDPSGNIAIGSMWKEAVYYNKLSIEEKVCYSYNKVEESDDLAEKLYWLTKFIGPYEYVKISSNFSDFISLLHIATPDISEDDLRLGFELVYAEGIGKVGAGLSKVGTLFEGGLKIDVDTVIDSANAMKKGGESVVGHALQKHAGRNPDIWGKIKGNAAQINETAMNHLDDILSGSGDFKTVTTDKGVKFLEKFLPDGRGIRLNMDGTFKGFIDQIK